MSFGFVPMIRTILYFGAFFADLTIKKLLQTATASSIQARLVNFWSAMPLISAADPKRGIEGGHT